jgi:RNA polymerase sigma-70 factor (ECF subfamily)
VAGYNRAGPRPGRSRRRGRSDNIARKPRKQDQDPRQTRWAREDLDVRLMLDFQEGDREAFRQLVERNQAKVYAVVYRLIPDHALAEDLTQEAFLRVFRTADRYYPMAKFSTWVYRIAANVALNALRSRRKMRTTTLEMPDGSDDSAWRREVPDERPVSPTTDLDLSELNDKLTEAIADLPPNQRVAITLSRFEHLSYQDIAEVLDCSTMAVKSLLSRARGNLRDALVRYLGPEFARKLATPGRDGDV